MGGGGTYTGLGRFHTLHKSEFIWVPFKFRILIPDFRKRKIRKSFYTSQFVSRHIIIVGISKVHLGFLALFVTQISEKENGNLSMHKAVHKF